MGKTLVIAEKPSVAGDIARAIGGLKKVGDHYEGCLLYTSPSGNSRIRLESLTERKSYTTVRDCLKPVPNYSSRLKPVSYTHLDFRSGKTFCAFRRVLLRCSCCRPFLSLIHIWFVSMLPTGGFDATRLCLANKRLKFLRFSKNIRR